MRNLNAPLLYLLIDVPSTPTLTSAQTDCKSSHVHQTLRVNISECISDIRKALLEVCLRVLGRLESVEWVLDVFMLVARSKRLLPRNICCR